MFDQIITIPLTRIGRSFGQNVCLLELLVDLGAGVHGVALDLLALRAEALALRARHLAREAPGSARPG